MIEPMDDKPIEISIEEELPKWVIPMTWQMAGNITVRARTLSDAIAYANSNKSPLPSGEYVADSCEISVPDEDYIREYYNNNQNDLDGNNIVM